MLFCYIFVRNFWPGNIAPPWKEQEFKHLKFSVHLYYYRESLTQLLSSPKSNSVAPLHHSLGRQFLRKITEQGLRIWGSQLLPAHSLRYSLTFLHFHIVSPWQLYWLLTLRPEYVSTWGSKIKFRVVTTMSYMVADIGQGSCDFNSRNLTAILYYLFSLQDSKKTIRPGK